ncbi:MAG TPA: hypothetical protein VNN20_13200 [Thermodesulfobacteriota bacterium]|nr:hypothetical protein [Thermodesulfobacteriota bacterium]
MNGIIDKLTTQNEGGIIDLVMVFRVMPIPNIITPNAGVIRYIRFAK